jgi:hypothetical protein
MRSERNREDREEGLPHGGYGRSEEVGRSWGEEREWRNLKVRQKLPDGVQPVLTWSTKHVTLLVTTQIQIRQYS